jgi:O-antigen/teichoic acid export membrane protein
LAFKRDLLIITAGRLLSTVIALASIRAVTSYLSPDKYGELSILVTVQMLCGLLLINPVGQHINLHTHEWWDDGTLIRRLKSYRFYILITALLGSLVSLGVTHSDSVNSPVSSMVVVFFMVAAGTWNATLIPMLNMLGFRTVSVGWSVISSATSLVASILFVTLWPSAVAWFAGQAVGMLIGAIGARYQLKRSISPIIFEQPRLPLFNRTTILVYCLPLALATGLMWVQVSGYRFIVEHYWGLLNLGLFAVGVQLAGQIWALAESLAIQFLYPFFFRRVSEHSNETEVELAVSDLLNTLVPTYLLLAGLTILVAPYLLKLLVAEEYSSAWQFMAAGAIIELCRALGNVLSNAAHIKRNTTSLAIPYASGAVMILFLIILAGENKANINWASAALVSGAVTMLSAMSISMYKQVKFKLDRVRCIAALALMTCMATLVTYLPREIEWITEVFYLVVISSFVAGVLFLMLWKNPATARLLNVQLRKN